MRVHAHVSHMSLSEADRFQYYLDSLEYVRKVSVNERTSNAIIYYDEGKRDALVSALSDFDIASTEVVVPDHTGRALRVEYEEKMFFHLAQKLIRQLFLPAPVRHFIILVKSVPYIIKGIKTLLEGKLEVSILDATSIAVSLIRGDYNTAGSVIFLLKVGDIMEEWTHRKSVDDLARAMSLNVDKVWTLNADDQEILTNIAEVREGDRIVVGMGSMIPLDGVVCQGDASVNQAAMTGESTPVHKSEDALVYAGTVVDEGEIVIRVTKAQGSGRYDRIVAMIEESEKLKSETEAKASHLADRLVPYTFGATLLTWLLTRDVTKATSILMVDFCCALKLSMPIAVLSAMREAGNHKMSIKGGKFLEAVAEAETIVFDKTGTLTYANPTVCDVITFENRDKDEMLRLAACLEEHYPHSIANAVVKAAEDNGLIHEEKHTKAMYIVAHGISSTIDGQKVCIGSQHFIFEDEGCTIPPDEEDKYRSLPDEYSHLYMAIGGALAAVILIEDPIREEASSVVRKLKEAHFDRVVMMTGDSDRTARKVAAKTGVTQYFSEVLPEDKAAFIRSEHEAGRKVIMVGDGINDSPALSEADAGIAVSSGASIAKEVADITISSDDLSALITLKKLSTKLMDRINYNYHAIIGFNSFLIVMGMLGIFAPTTTSLLHNTSTIALSLRSMTDLLDEGM